MADIKCPACGSNIHVTGLKPGSTVQCTCGNSASVPRASRKKLYLIVAGAFALLLIPCFFVVIAGAISGFQGARNRAMQSLCSLQLKQWYIAQKAHYAEHDVYEPVFAKVGFDVPRGNPQIFMAGIEPADWRDKAGAPAVEDAVAVGVDVATNPGLKSISLDDLPILAISLVGLSGECPNCDITMACIANLDGDADLDVWLISTKELPSMDGKNAEPGEPLHFMKDL